MRNGAAILFFILHSAVLLAQNYYFESYSVEDGLPQSQIEAIFQDSKGYLWMGTNGGGVTRYDGLKFETFSLKDGLSSNVIFSIYENKEGDILIGTEKGLDLFDGRRIENYFTGECKIGSSVYCITFDSKENLWIGTECGVYFVNEQNVIKYDAENGFVDKRIWSVTEDLDGTIWIVAQGGYLYLFRDNEFRDVSELLPEFARVSVFSIEIVAPNHYWLATASGLAELRNGKLNFTELVKGNQPIITEVIRDQYGVIWMSTDTEGIFSYDGSELIHYSEQNGFPSNFTFSIYEDRESNIWVGTDGKGIVKFNRSPFITYKKPEFFGDGSIWSIERGNNGEILIGSWGGGLVSLKNGHFEQLTTKQGLVDDFILSIYQAPGGDIWIGSNNGLSKYNDGRFKNYRVEDGLSGNTVWEVIGDPKGNIWCITDDMGVCKFDGMSFTAYDSTDGMIGYQVQKIYPVSDGSVWFGTKEGLVKYEQNQFVPILKGIDILTMIEEDPGTIWIGTAGFGILRLEKDHEGTWSVVDTISSDNGMNDDEILSLEFDNSGNLWCGTNRGVNKIDLSKYRRGVSRFIKSYSKDDGFISIECNHHALARDVDGDLWFGTIDGLIEYDPEIEKINEIPPAVHITGIRMFSEEVNWNDYSENLDPATLLPGDLKLSYDQNHLTFDFIGISLKNPEKVRYRYKLEGFDKSWSLLTKTTFATYSNLPAGEYSFKVRAINGDGIWSSKTAAFDFIINPLFWKTWWFVSISVLFVLIVSFVLIRIRLKRLEKNQAELEAKVEKRTEELRALNESKDRFLSIISHDLRSPFNALLGSAQLLNDEFPKLSEAEREQFVANIYQSLNHLYGLLENLLQWSTIRMGRVDHYPEQFQLKPIVENVKSYLKDVANQKNISILNNVSGDLPVYADMNMITSILQNLINNSIKFTNPGGEVKIDAGINGEYVYINVIDNGIGMDEEIVNTLFDLDTHHSTTGTSNERGSGLGLLITKEMVVKNGGRISVESQAGKGSVFKVKLPKAPRKKSH